MNGLAIRKTRILFVDDEPAILSGLRRQLSRRTNIWNMRFAGSGTQALQMLAADPADVVVSDMRMPGMNGMELLSEIRRRWPATVRIILSGHTDGEIMQSDLGSIHQFLDKPCDDQRLIEAVCRASEFTDALMTHRIKEIAAAAPSLPVLTDVHRRLFATLDHPDSDVAAVGEVVRHDVGLSAKLLQMVNSAFFGLPRPLDNPRAAVSLLGFKTVRFIAMAGRAFDAMAGHDDPGHRIRDLWDGSLEIAAAAGRLAKEAGQPASVVESARCAGMFSLIGRAVFARTLAGQLSAAGKFAAAGAIPLFLAETYVIGAPQHAMGAHMLSLWGIKRELVEAVAYQVSPELLPQINAGHPAAYVHAARCSNPTSGLIERLVPSRAFLTRVGIDELLDAALREAA